jgi:hypothetical protein
VIFFGKGNGGTLATAQKQLEKPTIGATARILVLRLASWNVKKDTDRMLHSSHHPIQLQTQTLTSYHHKRM